MHIKSSIAVSHVGKIRDHNEDTILADNDLGLWLVADGMGGHSSGEVASALAIEVIKTQIAQNISLKQALNNAHQAILDATTQNPKQQGMGTTVVAVELSSKGFQIGWAGDSRVYCFHKCLNQLTDDHTFVQDMVFREVLTPEEAATHNQRNLINRSLGMVNGQFSSGFRDFRPTITAKLLLCSDGVTDYLNNQHIEKLFKDHAESHELAKAIEIAVLDTEAGDNFSFIIIDFEVSRLLRWRNKLKL